MYLHIFDENLNFLNNINLCEQFYLGEFSYPDEFEKKFYIQNVGNLPIELYIEVKNGLSVYNFTDPPLIEDILLKSHNWGLANKYIELLFIEDNKVIDIANKYYEEFTVTRDPDGWVRGIHSNIDYKFCYPTYKNANSRIYLSDFFAYSGISKDDNGSPVLYQKKLEYERVEVNEMICFWYKFFLRKGFKGEENPRVTDLLIRGVDIYD